MSTGWTETIFVHIEDKIAFYDEIIISSNDEISIFINKFSLLYFFNLKLFYVVWNIRRKTNAFLPKHNQPIQIPIGKHELRVAECKNPTKQRVHCQEKNYMKYLSSA